jgi:hypothetical protein
MSPLSISSSQVPLDVLRRDTILCSCQSRCSLLAGGAACEVATAHSFIPRNSIISHLWTKSLPLGIQELDCVVFAGRKCPGGLSDRIESIDDGISISGGGSTSRTGVAPPKACIALQVLDILVNQSDLSSFRLW